MTKAQAEAIADRAAWLAVSKIGAEEAQDCVMMGENPYDRYYEEYLDQLQSGDFECLRYWLGWEIENRVQEAVEIMKQLIHARLVSQA